jgi:DNA-binding IclR family transcriptional regulator
MVGYNERKLQVLEYVEMCRMTTSAELAGSLNLEIHNARTLLKKYSRQGLLSRSRKDAWGTRVHKITAKGLRRLSYLKGTESSGLVEE